MISNEQINSLANSIAEKFNTHKVFLFGSYADGKPTLYSDLDICVITDFKGKRKIELIREIRREISKSFHNSLDILLYEETEFNERAAVKNTLENSILKNGIILNG